MTPLVYKIAWRMACYWIGFVEVCLGLYAGHLLGGWPAAIALGMVIALLATIVLRLDTLIEQGERPE